MGKMPMPQSVETAGIEPASEKQDQGPSTSLVCLYFLAPESPDRQGNPGTSRFVSPIRHGSGWISSPEVDAQAIPRQAAG